jgi:hypothetical protein
MLDVPATLLLIAVAVTFLWNSFRLRLAAGPQFATDSSSCESMWVLQ